MSKVFKEFVAQTSPFSLGLKVESASGCYITDREGRRFFDAISGISVSNVGHCEPSVVEAIKKQVEKYSHTMVYGEHEQKVQVDYALELTRTLFRIPQPQIFFTNSGTEATELALKMSRKLTGREKFLSIEGGFHGRTFGAMSVSWNDKYKQGFGTLLPCDFLAENQKLKDIDFTQYAGCIVELVQGEAGVKILNHQWVEELYQKCKEAGVMFIVDEVQTGFGRTGTFWAHTELNVKPDIVTMGKAMGGGLPIGGVASSRENFEKLQDPPFSHVTTFGGNPVSCAAGLAAFYVLRTHRVSKDIQRAAATLELLEGFMYEYSEVVREVRGIGFLWGIDFSSPLLAEEFVKECFKNNILVGYKLNNTTTVRVAPPLVASPEELKEMFMCFRSILREFDLQLQSRKLNKYH
jgi:acetylornithine/N-succinyldiaminopimelate aminotransferase